MKLFDKNSVDHFKSDTEKDKPDWYMATFDTYSSLAKGHGSATEIQDIHDMLHGAINKKEYSAFMNPFNFKEDRNKSIPGTLRNYDIMLSNVRKFIGEYVTSYQEFHVISSLPDEDNEMLEAANQLAYKLLSKKSMALMNAENNDTANPDANINVGAEVEEFKSSWKDNRVVNDHNMLEYLKHFSDDAYQYSKMYSDWIVYGRYFNHRKVYKDDVVKEAWSPVDTYPIMNDADFVEDYEGVLHEGFKSLGQIVSEYDEYLDEDNLNYIKEIEANNTSTTAGNGTDAGMIKYGYKLMGSFDDVSSKVDSYKDFSNNLSKIQTQTLYYKGFRKIQVLEYKDSLSNTLEMIVDEDYELNPLIGDVALKIEWYPCVYLQHRFGSKHHGVYTKPYRLKVQRQELNNNAKVKLPVTGKVGIFPGFPNHSIPKLLYPFQITINLLEMAKERAIITAQGKIAIIPKEMLGSTDTSQENELYNMLVLKKLFVQTANIPNIGSIINTLRDIDLSDNDYVRMLGELIVQTKEAAKDAIDMNRQRDGDTKASDGKGVNRDAVARAAMGSAIINTTFDLSRCKDYEADLDYSKVAWINGKKAKFVNSDRQRIFFEVNGTTHPETSYGVSVTTASDYDQQKQAMKDYAFALGQNGKLDEDVVLNVITNNNIAKIKEILKMAKALRIAREQKQFAQEQETRKHESDNALQAEQLRLKHEKQLNDDNNLTKMVIKEVDIAIAEMSNNQKDKDNEVLKGLQEAKQRLQTQLNITRRN